ncbi:MAG TPA: hypothetical protein VFD00_09795 [Thermoclostridium sp.]|nr:hypothetical protein [Thermoclostridium sp.]
MKTQFLLLTFILIFLVACSSNSPLTLQEAVQAVEKQEGQDFVLSSAAYVYTSAETYENKEPIFDLALWDAEATEDQYTLYYYEVGEQVKLKHHISYHKDKFLQMNLDPLAPNYEDIIFTINQNKIHKIVNTVKKARGRDLANEAFTQGFHLKGFSNEPWYILLTDDLNIDTFDMLIAAYNEDSDELFIPAGGKPYIFPRPQGDKKVLTPENMTIEEVKKIFMNLPYKDGINTNFIVIQVLEKANYWLNYNERPIISDSARTQYSKDYLVILGDTLDNWIAYVVNSNTLQILKMISTQTGEPCP